MATNSVMQPSSPYIDVPLRAATKDIRVLELLPGAREDELRVNLRAVSTEPKIPYYEALSYTWGSDSESREVTVNGKYRVAITNNLFRALRAMRKKRSSRIMWVDALCINQSNLTERGEQVAIMGRIYNSAGCVNVWLGEPGTTRVIKPDTIRVITSHALLPEILEMFRPFMRQVFCSKIRGLLSICRNDHIKLEEAMLNTEPSWYSRVWTVQECFRARRLFLWCGSKRIKYDFTRFSVLEASVHSWERFENFDRLRAKLDITADRPSNELSFYSLIQIMDSSAATNPLDRVYSLLSIMSKAVSALIRVDYSLPAAAVFARATFANIRAATGLRALCYVNTIGPRTRDLPSWAVDFAISKHGGSTLYVELGFPSNKPDQGPLDDSETAPARPWLALTGADRLLKVTGIIVDAVKTAVDLFGENTGEMWLEDRYDNERNQIPKRNVSIALDQLARSQRDLELTELDLVDRVLNEVQPALEGVEKDVDTWRIFQGISSAWKVAPSGRAFGDTLRQYYNGTTVDRPCLFTTPRMRIGLAPRDVVEGDVLACARGLGCLLVLRPHTDGVCYRFLGMAFIYGVDLGEVWKQSRRDGGNFEEFIVS